MNRWPITSDRFPFVPLTVFFTNRSRAIEALIDTGFDGDMVLPVDLIPPGEPVVLRHSFRLADGTLADAPVYYATAVLGTVRIRPVLVVALGNAPMIGRRLISHFAVTLDHGRRVIVEP